MWAFSSCGEQGLLFVAWASVVAAGASVAAGSKAQTQ